MHVYELFLTQSYRETNSHILKLYDLVLRCHVGNRWSRCMSVCHVCTRI